jgi:hypothetical protein
MCVQPGRAVQKANRSVHTLTVGIIAAWQHHGKP